MVLESDVVLVVDGAVERNLKLSFADLAQFPRHSLRATDELGKESLFEGVLVAEILKSAGVKFGKELRGKRPADYPLVDRRQLPRRLRSTRA
jgi:DMSO/TMAO reductase YedYZ molybdopterin-dependent catalytic subunit